MLIQSGLSEQIFEFHPLDGDMGSLRGGGVAPVGGKKSKKIFFFKLIFFQRECDYMWRLYVAIIICGDYMWRLYVAL